MGVEEVLALNSVSLGPRIRRPPQPSANPSAKPKAKPRVNGKANPSANPKAPNAKPNATAEVAGRSLDLSLTPNEPTL